MASFPEVYLDEVVENQGKLFDYVAQNHPQSDTKDFIETFMQSKTRKSMDEGQAYVNTLDAASLWEYFLKTDQYKLLPGKALTGFLPDWMGEFYAYYQWYYDMPSADVIKKIPLAFLIKAYPGLHDLELDLAVRKVGAS